MSDTAATDPPLMTVAEFLNWDDGTDTRHELVDGAVRAMAPPLGRHRRIVQNLYAALRGRLPAGCQADLGGGILWDETNWFEPDLSVTCRPIDPDARHVDDPVVIVEVLSPSTRASDFMVKLGRYKQIASVRDILLIEARRRWIEHWTRRADGAWIGIDRVATGEIALDGVPAVLTFDEIYLGLDG